MIICHLTSVHNYKDTRIFYKECWSLSKAGYEIHLIAPNIYDHINNGIAIHGINTPKNRLKRMLKSYSTLFHKCLKVDADIYHFHDPELIIVGCLLKMRGKKVIYDVHEDVPKDILSKEWIPSCLRKIISNLFMIIEELSARRFDYIITATPFISKRFIKLNEKVKTINNFPLLEEFCNSSKEKNTVIVEKAKGQVNLNNTNISNICYLGGITKVRGLFEMVDAMEKVNCKLLLAGTFNSVAEKEEVKKRKGWDKVIELGHLGRADVTKTLNRSVAGLVILHPIINYIDALPVKMFEYMAAGIPVIASDFPLWKEILEKHKCGITVNPLNINEIAKAIQWILDNPLEAFEMGQNGYRAVQEYYNWDIEAKNLLQVYEELK